MSVCWKFSNCGEKLSCRLFYDYKIIFHFAKIYMNHFVYLE